MATESLNDNFDMKSPKSLLTKSAKFAQGRSRPFTSVEEANSHPANAMAYRNYTDLIWILKDGIPTPFQYTGGLTDEELLPAAFSSMLIDTSIFAEGDGINTPYKFANTTLSGTDFVRDPQTGKVFIKLEAIVALLLLLPGASNGKVLGVVNNSLGWVAGGTSSNTTAPPQTSAPTTAGPTTAAPTAAPTTVPGTTAGTTAPSTTSAPPTGEPGPVLAIRKDAASQVGGNLTLNNVESPADGSMTCDTFMETATSGDHGFEYFVNEPEAIAEGTRIISFYVQAFGINKFLIYNANGTKGGLFGDVDLQAGTISNVQSDLRTTTPTPTTDYVWENIGASITALTGVHAGWYRIAMWGDKMDAGENITTIIRTYNDAGVRNHTGDASKGLRIGNYMIQDGNVLGPWSE